MEPGSEHRHQQQDQEFTVPRVEATVRLEAADQERSKPITIDLTTAPMLLRQIATLPRGAEVVKLIYDIKSDSEEPLNDTAVIERVIADIAVEEQEVQQVQEAHKELITTGHDNLRRVAAELQLDWDESREVVLIGPKMYQLYRLVSNMAAGEPMEDVIHGCDVGGQYFPHIDKPIVLYQPKAMRESRPWEDVIPHAIIHEGLHAAGGKVYDDDGKLVDRGIGGGTNSGVYSPVLEEGFIEWLTIRTDRQSNREPFNRYPNEVALFSYFDQLIGEEFRQLMIQAHREGKRDQAKARLDRIFGAGFFDIYSELKGSDSLVKDWPQMSMSEIQNFMSLLTKGKYLEIILGPFDEEKIKNTLNNYFVGLATEVMQLSYSGKDPEKQQRQLSKLPSTVRMIFEENPGQGFAIRGQVLESIRKHIETISA